MLSESTLAIRLEAQRQKCLVRVKRKRFAAGTTLSNRLEPLRHCASGIRSVAEPSAHALQSSIIPIPQQLASLDVPVSVGSVAKGVATGVVGGSADCGSRG